MCHKRRVLLLLVGIALGCAVTYGAPVPKTAQRPVEYFPRLVGARWVYGGHEYKSERKIIDALNLSPGRTLKVVETRESGEQVIELTASNANGITHLYNHGITFTPPRVALKLPHFSGQRWWNLPHVDGEPFAESATAFGPEDVVVPAGRFRAVRVVSLYRYYNRIDIQSRWYAPDIGLVKQVTGFIRQYAVELQSFTPGP